MTSLEVELDGRPLPAIARDALLEHFGVPRPAIAVPRELEAPGTSFVTLTMGGRLRGCVGSTEVVESLVRSVKRGALGAALRDPRFPAVGAAELDEIVIAVSVLSALEPIAASDRRGIEASIEPGVDGVLIRSGSQSATFLPQVWHELRGISEFFDELLRKAGLNPREWPAEMNAWRYRARTWRES